MNPIELDLRFEDGRRLRERHVLPLMIGRDAGCGLALRAWRVGRRHARLLLRQDEVWIEDLGSLFGTTVNGERVASYGPLEAHDEVVIGPCLMRVLPVGVVCAPEPATAEPSPGADGPDGLEAGKTRACIDREDPHAGPPARPASGDVADESWTDGGAGIPAVHEAGPGGQAHRRRLHEGLIAALQLRRRDIGGMSDAALRTEAAAVLAGLIAADEALPPALD
ncbi:MAG: FHA domain-containing protein, partial [Castellaniella sp.]